MGYFGGMPLSKTVVRPVNLLSSNKREIDKSVNKRMWLLVFCCSLVAHKMGEIHPSENWA